MDISGFARPLGHWLAIIMLTSCVGCSDASLERNLEQARAKTRNWADRLDSQTTETGKFIRHPGNQLPEKDPWGTSLRVQYSQGGVSESLTVSSAGPDRQFDTDDDIAGVHLHGYPGVGRPDGLP